MDTCIPKSENDVRLQAKFGSKSPTGKPVGVVDVLHSYDGQYSKVAYGPNPLADSG